jgi:hypothetical protein
MFVWRVPARREMFASMVTKTGQRVADRVGLLRALNLLDVPKKRVGCLEGCEKRAWVVQGYPKTA